jgi:FMN reductase
VTTILGIGGTISPTSSSDTAIRITLGRAAALGAKTRLFAGAELKLLPMYDPTATHRTNEATELVEAFRTCSGVIISSAAYHGSISGMLKNALDYIEDLSRDDRVYLSGVPVGLISVAKGWQAGVNNLATLRMIVHSLRGWPTPYGAVINTATQPNEVPQDLSLNDGLGIVAGEVVQAARMFESPLAKAGA